MKRPTAATSKESALARKRALIRSLIEQNGWSSVPTPAFRNDDQVNNATLPANVIPFPALRPE